MNGETRWCAYYVEEYLPVPDGEDFDNDKHVKYGADYYKTKAEALAQAEVKGKKTGYSKIYQETDRGEYVFTGMNKYWLENWDIDWDTEEIIH